MALSKFDFLYKHIEHKAHWTWTEESPDTLKNKSKGYWIEAILKNHIKYGNWEHFFEWDFITVWNNLGYTQNFEAYKHDFSKRMKSSLDTAKMIEVAIKQNEIVKLDYNDVIYQEDHIKRGIKLGYALAVNGENPEIIDIIFNLRYYFDSGYYDCSSHQEIEERVLCELEKWPFYYKVKGLHEVCEGYYRAKVVHFLNELKAIPDPIAKHKKIKTNLSVPDLVLLFDMLNKLSPKIFDVESDEELYKFISANFETKRSPADGISVQSIRNNVSNPDPKSKGLWEKHLSAMSHMLRKKK